MKIKTMDRFTAWFKQNKILGLVYLGCLLVLCYRLYAPIKTWIALHDYDAMRVIGLTLYEKERPCDTPV